jgi:hypothetical protein
MKSGRRRGFTDLIIRSLGAAASAALPAEGEAAGGEGLRARLHATPSLQPGAPASVRIFNQPEERKKA